MSAKNVQWDKIKRIMHTHDIWQTNILNTFELLIAKHINHGIVNKLVLNLLVCCQNVIQSQKHTWKKIEFVISIFGYEKRNAQ